LLWERKTFGIIRFTVTPSLLHTTYSLATPLLPVCDFFRLLDSVPSFLGVNFLLHRRGQKALSLANRGGIPIAGKLEIIRTYCRIGALISYSASLFANTFCCHPEEYRSGHYRPVRSTPRTCPSFAPLSQLVSLFARPLVSKT
jgi:hypothetical protein